MSLPTWLKAAADSSFDMDVCTAHAKAQHTNTRMKGSSILDKGLPQPVLGYISICFCLDIFSF
jgi:hypothetical protein